MTTSDTTPRTAPEVARQEPTRFRPLATILAVLAVAAIAVVVVWLLVGTESAAELEATALEELVAQEQAVLDPYFGNADPSGYVGMYADEITYFDSWSGGKLEGQAARDYLMSFAGTIPPLDYAILNPSVDLFNDLAIFTFNVDVIDPATGAVMTTWNTTEIHQSTGDGWEMVHAHWSQPVPAG